MADELEARNIDIEARRAENEIRESADDPRPTPMARQARHDPPGLDPATADKPLTGGRVDAEAATIGSHPGNVGATASGDPISSVGGAQGSQPADSVVDQPIGEEADEERAGFLEGIGGRRGMDVTRGQIRDDMGGRLRSGDDVADGDEPDIIRGQ